MFTHDPVLIREVESAFVSLVKREVVVDATLGLGGHASMFLSHMNQDAHFFAFDRDGANIDLARDNLETKYGNQKNIHLFRESFENIDSHSEIQKIDAILYDLGVSSAHYDDASRGFSIREDGPLDMRFDRTHGKTATDLIMTLPEKDLRHILFRYADEKKTHFIVDAILEKRKKEKLDTTMKLLKIIEESSFDPKSPIRVFQALRIAVNDEFGHIERSFERVIPLMDSGGIIMAITFHSIEDRLVKTFFTPYLSGTQDDVTGQIVVPPVLRKVTKKPIEPTDEEIKHNPRSRSAKLRIYQKL